MPDNNMDSSTHSEADSTEPIHNGIGETITVSHPYYLHPSDNPGLLLVAKPFNGSCFTAWRRSVVIGLSAKKKLRFINGSYVQPPLESPLFEHWEQCDNMIITWLLNSLDPEIAQSGIYLSTAKGIWDEINERYGQSNGAASLD